MPDPPEHALTRRGAWIGLRTLRQRPKVVDQTDAGEPIFEVRSVRLLLRADADHFNRLERCSKCGRQVPGAPVLEMADLDRPANPLICTGCVRAVAKPTAFRPSVRRVEPEPPTGEHEVGAPASPSEGDQAPASVEAAVADTAVRQDLEAVTALLEAQQRQIAALAAELAESRAELRAATESHRAVVDAQQALDERLGALAAQAPREPEDAALTASLERRLQEMGAALAEGLAQAGADARTLVGQLHEQVAALAQVIEGHRAEVASVLDTGVRAEFSTIAGAIGELQSWVNATGGRVQALERGLEGINARISALIAPRAGDGVEEVSPEGQAGSDLLGGLERQLQRAESRLSQLSVPLPGGEARS